MESPKLKVAFLVGNDSPSIRQSIEAVCRLPGLEPIGVLLDDEVVSLKQRQKNLFRNIRANGWSYPVLRIVETICTATTTAVNNAAVSRTEVNRVLKEAFPNTCFSLAELGEKYGMTIHAVGNLNSANAIRVLGECGADLGIVLGTRVLKAGTFAVPRMGCITLHKGKVPEYRGMPPGFWELYDGASSTDVSVRFVEKDLGSGDIVATSAVSIQKKTETPEKLLEKLHEEGSRVLASAVALIRDGKATRQSQGMLESKPRSKPTREDVVFLRRRLPHSKRNGAVSTIVRNLYVLFVYYSGLYFMVRQWHRLSRSRGAIVLYHRVNDYSKDTLTVDCRTFTAQLLAISQRYPLSSTADVVDRILTKRPLEPTTVAIHFDDCYRDILTNGAPIMRALGIPACAFINSGFVDTSRSFPHDAGYPFTYEMLRSSDVQTWRRMGFEVGAHTVNHVDLGKCAVEAADQEIVQCGQDLEKMIGKPVDLFSFPFGRPDNIRAATMQIIQSAGYIANFSAHGGFIGPGTDPYYIPRAGAHYESSPVYCLLQIEGLTLSRIARKVRSAWHSSTRVATQP
jgi:peptidoglycan/xylan/chitin deacetylase (PgdA/CDA1 family)